jgi:serine/threonine-protein kinase
VDEILLNDRYDLLAEIGRGERTVAYKAQDTSLNRTVVVKVLEERYAVEQEFVDRFQRAAQTMAGLSHPNVVAVYDMGSDKGLHYIVTEYVDGPSLESLLASISPLSVEQSVAISMSVCGALESVHQTGSVHGQLTPRSILLAEGQSAKVSDFGIVRTPPPMLPGEETLPRYSTLYLSPEQAMGRRATPMSDVYTLGVILHEMLTGRPPFGGEDSASIADKHIREEPQPPHVGNPQVPRTLSAVVSRALAKTSRDRYRTVMALEEALSDYRLQSEEIEAAERIRLQERRRALELQRVDEQTRARRRRLADGRAPSPHVAQGTGPDWAAIILGMIAFVAVVGLIPLWLMVYLRYFA